MGEGKKSSNGVEFFLSILLQILCIFCERFGSSFLPKCVDLFPVALCFLLCCIRTSSCAQEELGCCRNCELIYLLDKIRERGRKKERKKERGMIQMFFGVECFCSYLDFFKCCF